MKVVKSENEVVQMRRLGQAAARAFTDSMRQDFSMEKDLAAFLEYGFKANGCDTSAFVPVVAGGPVSRTKFLINIGLAKLTVAECLEHPLYKER